MSIILRTLKEISQWLWFWSNMWNTGRLWCRRQLYIEILCGQAQSIQKSALVYCAEDKTRSVYSAKFCSAQKHCWAGEEQWTWVQDQDLGLLHMPPALQQPWQPLCWDGSRSLGRLSGLDRQPLILDKYRFVAPAFAQTSSSLAHRQTELLCTQLAAVYCCSAQAIWWGFWILSRQLSGLCMAYTLWKVLLLTVCALLLKILLLARQVWGGTCCAPNPLFGTEQFNGI